MKSWFGWATRQFRRGPLFATVAIALFATSQARSDVITVAAGDFSDSRAATAGEIITLAGPWSGDPITFSWNITFDNNTGFYTYSYTLDGWSGGGSGLSHWDLTTSDGKDNGTTAFTEDNVKVGSDDTFINTIGDLNSDQFGAPTASYGIRWNKKQDAPPQTFVLVSDRAPIWGSFSAKSGGGTEVGAYSVGWGIWSAYLADDDITNFVFDKTEWIPVPDSISNVVPEPSSFVLAGLGLVTVVGVMRRRKAK